jgi:hypothetical protein
VSGLLFTLKSCGLPDPAPLVSSPSFMAAAPMDDVGAAGATPGACTADIGIVAICAMSAPSGASGEPGVLGASGWAGAELA